MSSDTKRYGSSFGRPSSSGASSFGFEPAANPLRASGLSDPNQGPKVYSGESFDEPAADDQGFEQGANVTSDDGYAEPAVGGYQASYDDNYGSRYDEPGQGSPDFAADGFQDQAPSDEAPAASLRDRLASRFGESLSFRRSRDAAPEGDGAEQNYDEQSYSDPDNYSGSPSKAGFGDESYSDYGDPSYAATGYSETDYSDGGYGDQGYGDQGYGDQGYGDQGYGDQGYGDQGYGDQGYDDPQMTSAAPAKERAASGWRSRFANRTAGLGGQDASADFQNADYGYGDGAYDTGVASGAQGYGDGDMASGGYSGFGQGDFGAQGYGADNYSQDGYNQDGFGQSAYGQNDYAQDDYSQSDFDASDDFYGGKGSKHGALAAPGIKRGFMSGFKLDLGSKWLMPAASIAGGVLVLAVLLYLFNPFAGNPLESPESIATVETMLAGLDIDPGPQDGIADEAYRLAIVEFQEMHGLSQTGELTPEVFQEMIAIYELSNL